ncbi:SPBc2 prophage-derived glycosyltransferase SunS [Anatilimnocola aggregata]|uniref:SPBc2 prophage-derived glycosyltransferase SunS n=1 Tax=Anatilimnocola aggregata TaxID=2528021 RepID=A0A517YM34_9BACT|nr:glycosyltransferase family 2 protein [Anatilimnocola aggregata]QDU31276.1 SPBc2 prophage-derived glycosyltransferase SunS [Anatilimnocola aggregata]
MPRLTVLIPCKDEIRHIRACIESVRPIADEILIADSGSTDGTLEAVREMGDCRVIEREYVNSANFKNWAIPQAKHEWVMVVDADERVTPELAAEIREVLQAEPSVDGYWLRRDFYFLGHPIRHGGWETATLVRLFRRDCQYQPRRVHADVVVPSGKVAPLKGRLEHFTAIDLAHFIERQHRYSTWSALDSFEKGKRAGILKMLTHAPLRFFQLYFLRGVFLDGGAGMLICGLQAYYTFLKDIKLWALANDRSEECQQLAPRQPRGADAPGKSPQLLRASA